MVEHRLAGDRKLNRRRRPLQGCVLPAYLCYFSATLTLRRGPSFVTIL